MTPAARAAGKTFVNDTSTKEECPVGSVPVGLGFAVIVVTLGGAVVASLLRPIEPEEQPA